MARGRDGVRTSSDGRDLNELTPDSERTPHDGARLRAHVERLEQSLRAQSVVAQTALADAHGAQQRAAAAESVSFDQQAQARALRLQIEDLGRALEQTQLAFAGIEQSNSWRLTLPLRLLRKVVRRTTRPPVAADAPRAASAPVSGENASPVTPEPPAAPAPGLAEATERMRVAAHHWSLGQRR